MFFVVGVWHGAAWKYIMYGIYNGVIVAGSGMLAPVYAKIQEKLHINPKKWWYQGFCIIRTFILVNIGFYFDMANDLRAANAMLVQTVTTKNTKMSASPTGRSFPTLLPNFFFSTCRIYPYS